MNRFLVVAMLLGTLLGLSPVSAVAQDESNPDLYCSGYVAIGHPKVCYLPIELGGGLQMDFVTFPIYGEFAFSQTSKRSFTP